jgi:acyl dehydratase
MTHLNYDTIKVGDKPPDHICGPISRTTLALFGGASGDHNPMHVDIDFAKKFGMPDVFAHGMLSMAYLAQLVTNWADQSQLREYGVRFTSITPVLATVTCKGKVVEKMDVNNEPCLKVEVTAEIDDGTSILVGDAIIGFGK